MAMDFPTSPTTGQTVYLAGNSYTWDGTKWWTSVGKAAAVRQTFTAGAGQTSFTVTGGYFAGTIDVYLNGVKLVVGDDVTASDGSTVVLASGATAGDVLEVVSFNSFSIANMLPLTGGTLTGGLIGTTGAFSGALSGSTVADSTGTIRRMVTGTPIATTSGTAIDLNTALPNWVRRITVAYSGVSLNASSHSIIQLGSGTYTTTGYLGTAAYAGTANSAGVASATNGLIAHGGSSTNALTGTMTIVLMGSNLWVASHTGMLNTTIGVMGGGSVTLGGTLDRIRIASANGTDTFDAGSVNILYEG